MPDVPPDNPGVRPPPPLVMGGLLLLAWGAGRVWPVMLGPPAPALGVPVALLGVVWVGWALLVLVRAGNDPRPDRPDAALVTAGPFRRGRNPIYLGFLGVMAGMALAGGQLWGWLAAGAAFLWLDRAAIRREERFLRARFPGAYDAYASRARRWL